MPEESDWEQFFDAGCIIETMECARTGKESIAEFGSGYGTFTIPAAMRTSGTVRAFEIEQQLVTHVQERAMSLGLTNIIVMTRDIVAEGTSIPSESVDHVMIYNLLHIEGPIGLLMEACRILRPGGTASIIHWKFDSATPRGPSMNIRPKPEQCRGWAEAAGFDFLRYQDLAKCCAYHYGLIVMRPAR